MLGRAVALYFRHFGAVLLTAGVALVPANLLMAGAVRYGLARISAAGLTETPSGAPRREDFQRSHLPAAQSEPQASSSDGEATGSTVPGAVSFRSAGAIAYAVIAIAVLMFAGVMLAHAALFPLVAALDAGEQAGAHEAWAAASGRIGPLFRTGAIELVLIGVGTLLCVLPGLLFATVFAFAVPATLVEGVSGKAALDRSVALMKGRWGGVLAMLALMILFTAASAASTAMVPAGPWRLVVPGVIRVVTYPLPLVGLCLLYPRR